MKNLPGEKPFGGDGSPGPDWNRGGGSGCGGGSDNLSTLSDDSSVLNVSSDDDDDEPIDSGGCGGGSCSIWKSLPNIMSYPCWSIFCLRESGMSEFILNISKFVIIKSLSFNIFCISSISSLSKIFLLSDSLR